MPPRQEVDPNDIIEGARTVKASQRLKGLDYPIPVIHNKKVTSGPDPPVNEEATSLGKRPTDGRPSRSSVDGIDDLPFGTENPTKKKKGLVSTLPGFFSKKRTPTEHASKLRKAHTQTFARTDGMLTATGDAIGEDGRLKDASEITWRYDPDDDEPQIPHQSTPESAVAGITGGASAESDDDYTPVNESAEKAGKHRTLQTTDDDAEIAEGNEDVDGEDDGDGASDSDGETEDEGTKRFNELVMKMGKPKPRKTQATRDLRPFFKADTRKIDSKVCIGYYCTLCLAKQPSSRAAAFIRGNVSTRRTHLSRFHYQEYYNMCTEKGWELKARTPKGWKDPASKSTSGGQSAITRFTEKRVMKPKVDKAGILEHLLELVVDADLSFRFVERPSFRNFCMYINPKLKDTDIPHKTAIADRVLEKGEQLDLIELKIIAGITSRITLVYDGWSSKNRRAYTAMGIQYIQSSPEDDNVWVLKRQLVSFDPSPGRHTGKALGREMVTIIKKFNFQDKFGWSVGDNIAVNDVAVRYKCRKLNAAGRKVPLDARESRGRCISHTVHLGPGHFIKALVIPGIASAKSRAHKATVLEDNDQDIYDYDNVDQEPNLASSDDEAISPDDEYDEEYDVDTNPDIEADPADPEALLETLVVDHQPGDVIGKLLAFINQLRACGESSRDYFNEVCAAAGLKPRALKLWVRTRWGSLADCFGSALAMQRGIDHFCSLADSEPRLPPLRNRKKWSNFKLTQTEWKTVSLAYDVLQVAAVIHADLSADRTPTLQRVYLLLEKLMSEWEKMAQDPKYGLVKKAIEAGLSNMVKWYRKTDETSIYFVAHVLDPVYKDRYLKAAWEAEYYEQGMDRFKKIFLQYKLEYDMENAKRGIQQENGGGAGAQGQSDANVSSADAWMAGMLASVIGEEPHEVEDPLSEFNAYFSSRLLSRSECPNPISWWGHQRALYPVMRQIAKDYLAVPASSCLIERAFSMSARTDDPRRRSMGDVKFGVTQRLRDAYREGRLEAITEAWSMSPDFEVN